MRISLSSLGRFAVTCLLIAGSLGNTSLPAGADHSIYFPHVVELLKLNGQLRAKVKAIVDESERQTLVVFKKFGIDPRAKPEFNKLVKARHELQAIERNERTLLKEILSTDQLKDYDRIIEFTHAEVVKATRNED